MPSDSSDSRRRRGAPGREPATIDLSATEVRTEPSADVAAAGETAPGAEARDINAGETAATDASPRPTPDEVIPTDEVRAFADQPPFAAASDTPAADAPPDGRRGLGIGAVLAAAVVGGVVGAGAALLTESWRRPSAAGDDTRLSRIEQRVAAIPQVSLGPLEVRVAALETQDKTLAERITSVQASAERMTREAQERAAAPAAPARDAESAAAVADLTKRLAGIEKQLQERAQAAANVEKQLQERAQATASLQSGVAAVQTHAQAAATAAQGLEKRVADQDQRLAALAKQLSDNGPNAMTASLRVTLADRLDSTLDEGAPLGQILNVLGRVDVKPERLQPLQPYAKTGAPTADALVEEFRPIARRMVTESRTAGSWDERLWRMLDKVVTVRAVGDPQGSDLASLVARVESALARDDLQAAATAWDALPEASRASAQAFGAKLKARADAEAAARTLYAEALSGLEASTR